MSVSDPLGGPRLKTDIQFGSRDDAIPYYLIHHCLTRLNGTYVHVLIRWIVRMQCPVRTMMILSTSLEPPRALESETKSAISSIMFQPLLSTDSPRRSLSSSEPHVYHWSGRKAKEE